MSGNQNSSAGFILYFYNVYVVYVLAAEPGGEVVAYVGSGKWPQRLVAHAKGHSSFAKRGARPLCAIVLAVFERKEEARRAEAYFQRLLGHVGRRVRAEPLPVQPPGEYVELEIAGLTVYVPSFFQNTSKK